MPLLDGTDPAAVGQAARQLAAGALVAFPTETVYGLGARADDDRAVARIFAAKGRPADHPLIVHVADAATIGHHAVPPTGWARRLVEACWPGPLTLILERRPGVAEAAAGGQATIGLRCPAHPVAHALLVAAAAEGVRGVAAPSANRFGRVSPTRAEHVQAEFGDALLVLDGGPCDHGIESTIIDASRGRPVLLRPGTLDRARLEALIGEPLQAADALAPRASGTLASHYAPDASVRLMDPTTLRAALAAERPGPAVAVYSRDPGLAPAAGQGHRWRPMPADPAAAAHELYAALRGFDADGVQAVWIELPPPDAAWDGVRDRLQRAAAAR